MPFFKLLWLSIIGVIRTVVFSQDKQQVKYEALLFMIEDHSFSDQLVQKELFDFFLISRAEWRRGRLLDVLAVERPQLLLRLDTLLARQRSYPEIRVYHGGS